MTENEVQKNNEARKNDDDEISLIDLFVVLLKYRRLIIGFIVLGFAVSAAHYVIQTVNGRKISSTGEAWEYEGSISVAINPRLGRDGTEKFPAWFNSRKLFEDALEEAGLGERTFDSFVVTYNQNDGVNSMLKPGAGDEERVEKFFSMLLNNAESMAADYYAGYAKDIILYFESLQDTGKDYSAHDYVRYCWAKDILSGKDTVLKALYPPLVRRNIGGWRTSTRIVSLVIFIAFLFFAVFLAFVLNAIRNISSDSEVTAKIRGALGKENRA
jgi:hypothetical protein